MVAKAWGCAGDAALAHAVLPVPDAQLDPSGGRETRSSIDRGPGRVEPMAVRDPLARGRGGVRVRAGDAVVRPGPAGARAAAQRLSRALSGVGRGPRHPRRGALAMDLL